MGDACGGSTIATYGNRQAASGVMHAIATACMWSGGPGGFVGWAARCKRCLIDKHEEDERLTRGTRGKLLVSVDAEIILVKG